MTVWKGLLAILFLFVALGGSNYYIAHRLCRTLQMWFPRLPSWLTPVLALVSCALLVLSFCLSMLPVSAPFRHVLGTVGFCWMGIFLYLLLFLLGADLLVRILHLVRIIPTHLLARCSSIACTASVVLALCVSCFGFVHARRITPVPYEIDLSHKGLTAPMHIVMLSDLHLGSVGSESRLDEIVDAINDMQPDLVCIAGDLFDNDFGAIRDPEAAAGQLRQIRVPYGVWACPGNHDAGDTAGAMADFLTQCNIRLLTEEHTVIDNRLILVGRSDASPIGSYTGTARQDTDHVLDGLDDRLPIVVMDHNPAHANQYPDKVSLILCGHTHKGQLFPGGIITRYLFPVDQGYYRRTDTSPHVIVSSGIGTWGPPMRVGTDSELVSIRLTNPKLR